MSKKLIQSDFCRTAKAIGCEVEAIQAVARVESGGRGGFDEKGRLLLRFEGHHFRKYTNGKYDKSHPHLSYPYSQQRIKPHGYSAFNEAFALDPVAAMLACSYGMFQILGSHYDDMGFDTVGEFVDFLKRGEAEQLEIFVRFCRVNGLIDELKRLDFAGFARVYNGANYRDFNYDGQMRGYYKSLKVKNIDCAHLLTQIERAEKIRLTEVSKSSAAPAARPPQDGPSANPSEVLHSDSPATVENQGETSVSSTFAPPEFTEGERPAQIAENITNVQTGDKTVPDNFVPEEKIVNAPPPSGMMNKAAVWMAGLGLGVPSLGGAVQSIKNLAADGTINLQESLRIAGIVFKFIFPYAIWIAVAFIAFWGLKEILKQISLIVKIWVTAKADMNNVEVRPITYQTGDWQKETLLPEKEQPISIINN